MPTKRFRIAFSFAGETRDFVAQVAAIMAQHFGQDRILYDKFHEAEFARYDLGSYLPKFYHDDADLVVVVLCPHYDQKRWTGWEWQAIQAQLTHQTGGNIMLTRFGHATVGGLFENAGFVELEGKTPAQAAGLILERLAVNEGRPKDHYTAGITTGRDHPRQTIPNNLPRLPYFFGREAELRRIADALVPEARGWGALIDGPGGIGKTALAIRAAELVPSGRFRRIIFLSAKERELTADGQRALGYFVLPTYLEMLNAIASELGQPDLAKSPVQERAALVVRALQEQDILLLLDNLENLPESDRDQLFTFLNRLPGGCSALVTSRRRADAGAVSVRLDRLDWEATRDLLGQLSSDFPQLGQASEADRRALYEQTGGNPLLIRWVAGQLGRGRCRSVAAALELLRSAPPDNNPLEFIFGDLLDTFTPGETKVLAALSHFSEPMEVQFIAELSEVSATVAQTALDDLAARALVLPDMEARRFVLVPMVADFLRRQRPKAVAETGNQLEKRAYALMVENGYQKYERFPVLEAAWPTVAPALPLCIAGPNVRLQTVCAALRHFLNFTGRWDVRLALSQQAEAKALAAGDHHNAGWRAYDMGWVHWLRRQADAALACADRAAAHWQTAQAGAHERATAIRLRGIGQQLQKDYPAAIAAYREALDLWRTVSSTSQDVASVLSDLADVEWLSGDLPAAERDYRAALHMARALDDTEGVAIYTGNLAELALDRNDWPQAEALAREALALAEKIGRQELIAADCRRLARALLRQGQPAAALPYAQRAVDIYTRLGSPDLKYARAVLTECAS